MSLSPSHSSKQLTIIVAATLDNGIGLNGTLPWRLSQEMKWFARVTTESHSPSTSSASNRMNAVIMGRKTWESIPPKWRPLKGRWNCVISRSGVVDGIEKAPYTSSHSSVLEAVQKLESPVIESWCEPSSQLTTTASPTTSQDSSASDHPAGQVEIDRIFLIGGSQLYHQSLSSTYPSVSRILLTRIHHPYPTDVTFPDFSIETREKDGNHVDVWRKADKEEVEEWVGWEVEGAVEGKDNVRWEVEMWVRI